MKVKCDFVTNSSSTSFCLWGTSKGMDTFLSANGINEEDYRYKCIDDILEKTDLDYHIDSESDIIYIGISPERMEENETLHQFKEKVQRMLKEVNCNEYPEFIAETIYS